MITRASSNKIELGNQMALENKMKSEKNLVTNSEE
jgi:hypothetical protein